MSCYEPDRNFIFILDGMKEDIIGNLDEDPICSADSDKLNSLCMKWLII